MEQENNQQSTTGVILKKFWDYITFKKPDPDAPKANASLKAMHIVNKISILMFIVAMVILIVKWLS